VYPNFKGHPQDAILLCDNLGPGGSQDVSVEEDLDLPQWHEAAKRFLQGLPIHWQSETLQTVREKPLMKKLRQDWGKVRDRVRNPLDFEMAGAKRPFLLLFTVAKTEGFIRVRTAQQESIKTQVNNKGGVIKGRHTTRVKQTTAQPAVTKPGHDMIR